MRSSTLRMLYMIVAVIVIALAIFAFYGKSMEGFQSVQRAQGYLKTIADIQNKVNSAQAEARKELATMRGAADKENKILLDNIKNREAKAKHTRPNQADKDRLKELYQEKSLYAEVLAKTA